MCPSFSKDSLLANLNICSLLHKVQELSTLLSNNNFNVIAMSETHLDTSVNGSEVVSGKVRHDLSIFQLAYSGYKFINFTKTNKSGLLL